MRDIIYIYYYILYLSEYLAERDSSDYYAKDESLFTHDKNWRQIWIINIINNNTRNFRLETSLNLDSETIKNHGAGDFGEGLHTKSQIES